MTSPNMGSFHTIKRGLLVLLLAFSLLTTAFARKQETGFLDRTISVGGETYRYQVFVPNNWNKHQKWPVILFLHGYGERGVTGLLQTDVGIGHAIRKYPGELPFIVVMPQCRADKATTVWTNDPAMEQQALAALDASIHEFHGDPNRVYLTGLSMGGYATWDLAAKYPHRFAAYAPICGGIHGPPEYPEVGVALAKDPKISDPYAETARLIGSTPVWMFHGDADPSVPVEESRKMYAALQAAHANVKYTEYPGVPHNSWDKAYAEPDLFPWLLQHKLQP